MLLTLCIYEYNKHSQLRNNTEGPAALRLDYTNNRRAGEVACIPGYVAISCGIKHQL